MTRLPALLWAALTVPILLASRFARAEGSLNLLINPGADSGSLAGWTLTGPANAHVDAGTFNPGLNPQAGAWDFVGGTGASATLSQFVPLDGLAPVWQQIDAGSVVAHVSFYQQSVVQSPADTASVSVQFYDASLTFISLTTPTDYSDTVWTNHTVNVALPIGTRYIYYVMNFNRHAGNDLDAYIDSNSLTLGFNGTTWSSAANDHLWSTAANWVSGVPSTFLPARLTRASGPETVTFDGNYDAPLSALYIDSPAGITLSQPVNTMRANNEFIGNAYSGTYTQSGGANITPNLYLGNFATSHGIYNLSGGTLSADALYVGNDGNGAFFQSGGSNNPQFLYLGYTNMGSGSTYTLSAGSLSVSVNEYIGHSTSGSFFQSGGTHTAQSLYVGYFSSGAGGSYVLSGGSLSVATFEYLGYATDGSFSQTGGTHNVTQILNISFNGSSTGSYNLTGGTLIAGLINVGYSGVVGESGSLTVSGTGKLFATIDVWESSPNSLTLDVGGTINGVINSHPSQFHFLGGTINWTNPANFTLDPGIVYMPISSGATWTGSQVLNLPISNFVIGNGNLTSFTMAGPETITVGDPLDNRNLQIGPITSVSQDSLTLSHPDAKLIVNGTLYVGGSSTAAGATGLLAINNGHVSANTLKIWFGGTATLSAGSLDVGSLELFSSTITINGGTATILNPVSFHNAGTVHFQGGTLRITALETSSNPAPNFAWSGGTLVLLQGSILGPASFIVPAPGTLSGSGIVASPIVLNGTISLNTSNDILTVQGTIIGPGNISLAPGTSLNSDGIRINNLSTGGLVRIRANGTAIGASKLTTLTLAGSTNNWTGKLDLTNNALIVAGPGAANIPNQLKQGANLGAWNGPAGISSSSAQTAASTSTATALAYATGAQFTASTGQTQFAGQPFLTTDTLVMYTLAGDANMDKSVTFADFLQLQNHYNQPGTDWQGGDFNYDGSTTFADFLILQNNYNKTLQPGNLSPDSLSIQSSGGGGLGTSTVPEPASLALLGLAIPLLFSRRRRSPLPTWIVARCTQ